MKKASIGVDIGGTSIKFGLVDEKGRILLRDTFLTGSAVSKTALLNKLVERIKIFQNEAGRLKLQVLGVGIGAPGPIDVDRGFVYFFPNIKGWENTYLRKILEKKTGLPVFVENDANAMTLGEFYFGAGRGVQNMIALTLGTGVGGGLILGGKLFHGPSFSAAEIGHMSVDPSGPLCGCGNTGCIETFLGNGYLVRRVEQDLKKGQKSLLGQWTKKEGMELTPKLIQEAAKAGDAYSIKFWQETGQRLGVFLAGLVNLLNPEKIVVGGGIALGGELVLGPVRATIKKKAFPIASSFVKVVPAVLGSDAGLVGAAALVFSGR